MLVRIARDTALASMLTLGLVTWTGCSDAPTDGTPPTTVQKIENKAGEILKKTEDAASKAGEKAKEVTEKAVDATGKAMKKAGEKLQESVKKD